jgi:hypothetical protein
VETVWGIIYCKIWGSSSAVDEDCLLYQLGPSHKTRAGVLRTPTWTSIRQEINEENTWLFLMCPCFDIWYMIIVCHWYRRLLSTLLEYFVMWFFTLDGQSSACLFCIEAKYVFRMFTLHTVSLTIRAWKNYHTHLLQVSLYCGLMGTNLRCSRWWVECILFLCAQNELFNSNNMHCFISYNSLWYGLSRVLWFHIFFPDFLGSFRSHGILLIML